MPDLLALVVHGSSVGQHMDLIPQINTYLPLVLVAIVLLVVCHAFERLMRLIGVDIKGAPTAGNVDDEEKIREGRALIRKGGTVCPCFPGGGLSVTFRTTLID